MNAIKQGSNNAEQELTPTLLGSDEEMVGQVEATLRRIDDGDYGHCGQCGEQIAKTRLDVGC